MHPPTKDQTDIGKDNPKIDASDKAIIELNNGDIIENKDMARQEFAQDADINYMLHRFGLTPARGAPTFGEWDDTLDLQQALTSVTEARDAYKDLPEELKNKFSSMEQLLDAYHKGALIIKEDKAPLPVKTETQLLQERIDELQKRINGTQATAA